MIIAAETVITGSAALIAVGTFALGVTFGLKAGESTNRATGQALATIFGWITMIVICLGSHMSPTRLWIPLLFAAIVTSALMVRRANNRQFGNHNERRKGERRQPLELPATTATEADTAIAKALLNRVEVDTAIPVAASLEIPVVVTPPPPPPAPVAPAPAVTPDPEPEPGPGVTVVDDDETVIGEPEQWTDGDLVVAMPARPTRQRRGRRTLRQG